MLPKLVSLTNQIGRDVADKVPGGSRPDLALASIDTSAQRIALGR